MGCFREPQKFKLMAYVENLFLKRDYKCDIVRNFSNTIPNGNEVRYMKFNLFGSAIHCFEIVRNGFV